MARKKKEVQPLERVFELIDEKIVKAGEHTLAAHDLQEEITALASEAKRQGAPMSELAARLRKMDIKERKLKPVTRQAVDIRLAVHENRRPARTTRASRRKREPVAGKINPKALQ